MKIVIIGAGISGCSAYLALRKHLPKPPAPAQDHEYTIYEAYDVSNDQFEENQESTHSATLVVGGGLGIGPNGLNVLRRLDETLLKDITRAGYAYSHFNMKNKHGRTLMSLGGSDPAMNSVGCSRHSLWRCLKDRIPEGVIINKRVSMVETNAEDRNTIRFADESPPAKADLVIGADGLKSTAKRALFPEAKEGQYAHQYEGLVGLGGFAPAADFKDCIEKGSMNLVFGGNGFFGYFYSESSTSDPNRDSPCHISEPGETASWWSTYSIDDCPDPKTIDMDDVTRQLRERYRTWKDPIVQKIISSTRVTSMYPVWTSPPLPTWERDGVILLGDAAHALPPTSGQGSSQALEDVECFARFLSHYLGKVYLDPSHNHDHNGNSHGDENNATRIAMDEKQAIKVAAKRHMDLRKPRVQAILDGSRKVQNSKRPMTAIQEYIMYCILWFLGRFPRLVAGQQKYVFDYDIAADVDRALAAFEK